MLDPAVWKLTEEVSVVLNEEDDLSGLPDEDFEAEREYRDRARARQIEEAMLDSDPENSLFVDGSNGGSLEARL